MSNTRWRNGNPADNFQGRMGRLIEESSPWWPEPVKPPQGAPNILVSVLRRPGFLRRGLPGRRDRHAPHRPPGRGGSALHQLHHRADVLASAGSAADGQEPPRRGLRLDRPCPAGLPWLQQRDRSRRTHVARDAEGTGLFHHDGWQVAQHLGPQRARRGRPQQLAAATRL
jgi:hypothetical protein